MTLKYLHFYHSDLLFSFEQSKASQSLHGPSLHLCKTALQSLLTFPVSVQNKSQRTAFEIHHDLQVDLVLVPAVTGDFGVMPGHVPTVAQLRPGVVTVHTELDKEVEKYFVSSGFAFVHADSSADVVAVEAVKLDELDTEAVRAGLQVTTRKPRLWAEDSCARL